MAAIIRNLKHETILGIQFLIDEALDQLSYGDQLPEKISLGSLVRIDAKAQYRIPELLEEEFTYRGYKLELSGDEVILRTTRTEDAFHQFYMDATGWEWDGTMYVEV